jgi:hypothetical protein
MLASANAADVDEVANEFGLREGSGGVVPTLEATFDSGETDADEETGCG